MHKIVLAALSLGLVAAAVPASAQSGGSYVGSLGGGVSLPVGDFSNFAKTGWHGAATMGFHPAASKWDWLVDASYHHFSDKSAADAHDNLFVALARGNYWTGTNVYLLAGAGVMRNEATTTIVGVSTKNSTTAFAIAGGVGVALGKSLFVEGRVLNGFTKGSSTTLVPFTIGVRF